MQTRPANESDDTAGVQLPSSSGLVQARFYPAGSTDAPAVLCVGGVGGGFDSPAMDLYGRLARGLPEEGISVLRVRFRNATDLEGSVRDVRAGVSFLRERGAARIALLGHSFGGAVVIRAAHAEAAVTTVITLATQGFGTEHAGQLRRPVLLIHGTKDEILPPFCSEHVHARLGTDGELRLFEDARHGLHEVADDVWEQVTAWLEDKLVLSGPSPA